MLAQQQRAFSGLQSSSSSRGGPLRAHGHHHDLKTTQTPPLYKYARQSQHTSVPQPRRVEQRGEFGFPLLPQRFKLDQVIGRGSFGTCRMAHDLISQDVYAIKIMPKERKGVPFERVCDKYQREVSILSRMQQSPHVVDLYGVYEDEDSLYILMELLEGGELSAMLARPERPCKEEMALILRQVLSFLAHAHANGICYGDVKPGNFLFRKRHNAHEFQDLLSKPCEGLRCYGPEIKVVDFGCSQYCFEGVPLRHRTGTPVYLAPEVYNRDYSTPADVWSAGVLAYHLITGRLPFWQELKGLTAQGVMAGVLEREPDFSPDAWNADFGDDCRDLLRSMMHKDPAQRPTAQQCLEHAFIATYTAAFVFSPSDRGLAARLSFSAAPRRVHALAPPSPMTHVTAQLIADGLENAGRIDAPVRAPSAL